MCAHNFLLEVKNFGCQKDQELGVMDFINNCFLDSDSYVCIL